VSEQLEQRWNRVLVGVDGSPASRRALAFAENEARMRGADLVVVTSVDVPDEMWLRPYADLLPSANLVAKARERAATVISEELGDQPAVRVMVEVTTTSAAAALVDRSKEADLLVVGSRGHGGFRGLAMGSVSTQCVAHAHCPVTVVRARPAQPATADELTEATATAS
jgi:nucleotide-binding universal stress UspA family protein